MIIDKFEIIDNFDKDIALSYIYSLEKNSNHPISSAIAKIKENIKQLEVVDYKEIAGHGLVGKIENVEVLFGNKKLLKKYEIEQENLNDDKIYLVANKKVVAYIMLKEEIREESSKIVEELKKVGVKKEVILTGDNKLGAEKIANQLNIKNVYSSLLPDEKLDKIEELKSKDKVMFVGDGINDSPVLAASNFGIAMGEGAEIAAITADGILLSNNILKIPTSIKIAKRTMNIVKVNILFSLVIKLIVLSLGFLGIAPIWAAVFADVGVTFITVLNSIRILKM